MEEKINKIWNKLDSFSLETEQLETSIREVREDLAANYTPLVDFEEFTDKSTYKANEMAKKIANHETHLASLDHTSEELSDRMKVKTDKADFVALKADLERHALYDDLKDLYNKTVKPVSTF